MPPPASYNFKQLIVSVAANLISGFIEGNNAISITRVADGITEQVGSDGEIAIAIQNNRLVEVTLRLQQHSASNDILSGLHRVHVLTGLGLGPLLVKDPRGRTVIASDACWVKKYPDVEFGNELGTREWVLRANVPEMFVGGNF